MTINTCALYGASTYANSWLGINVLIIIISLMAVAVAFSLSSLMPSRERGRIRGFVRFEMIQTILSVIILVAILGLATTACSISANISTSLSGTTRSPFQYADWYIGTVSLNHGLSLLTNLYAIGVRYSVYTTAFKNVVPIIGTTTKLSSQSGGLQGVIGWLFGKRISGKGSVGGGFFINYEIGASGDVSTLFGLLSSTYLVAFSPIIMIAVGLLFIQFLALPVMQYTAFTVVLPIAIAARSIAFFSSSVGDASNALIAIAIAFYIIYPMMIAFDSYAIAYVFSSANPSAQYVNLAFTVNTVSPNSFFTSLPTNDSSIKTEWSFLSGAFSAYGNPWYNEIVNPVTTLRQYINLMAEFVFESILLFAINIAVTVGLAISLYKGLKSGLGESGRFW